MTQSLSIPLAWCVELEKLVTPQDVLRNRAQHPDQKLSFLCPECDLPIIFHPNCSGIRAHAYFIRKSGQYHQGCAAKISREHPLPQDLILMQSFEETFVQAENTNKELSSLLAQLADMCVTLRDEVGSNCKPQELDLLHLLEQKILRIQTPNLAAALQEVSTTYLNLRQYLQGF